MSDSGLDQETEELDDSFVLLMTSSTKNLHDRDNGIEWLQVQELSLHGSVEGTFPH